MKFNFDISNVNYIKIIYKDENAFPHCIKAALKDINEHSIYASAKFDENLFIKTPQYVELGIITDTGLYKAFSDLKYITKEPPYVFFTIKTPDDMEYHQNREFFRVKMDENATISYLEGEQEKQISCETYDISANGVRLIMDSYVEFPEVVRITLHLPNKDIVTDAKYVRKDEEDGILKFSFSYTDIKEADLDYISQICFKKQLELRRKML